MVQMEAALARSGTSFETRRPSATLLRTRGGYLGWKWRRKHLKSLNSRLGNRRAVILPFP